MERFDALKLTVFGSLFFFLVLLLLVSMEPGEMRLRAAQQMGVELEIGAELYSLHCRSCHGIRGEGVGQLGPALSDEHFFKRRLAEVSYQSTLENYILTTTEHGRMMGTRPFYAGDGTVMVMPPWHRKYGGPLRDDQLQAVTAFILNWEQTAVGKVVLETLEIPKSDPGDPEVISRGKEVFIRHCASCHKAKGINEATVKGPDLSHLVEVAATRKEGLDGAEYIRESITVPARYLTEGYEQVSNNSPCGSVLAETELQAVTAFLLQ